MSFPGLGGAGAPRGLPLPVVAVLVVVAPLVVTPRHATEARCVERLVTASGVLATNHLPAFYARVRKVTGFDQPGVRAALYRIMPTTRKVFASAHALYTADRSGISQNRHVAFCEIHRISPVSRPEAKHKPRTPGDTDERPNVALWF